MTVRICVFTEPHRGADYDDQLRFVRLAEDCGFEGFFRADHYQAMGADPGLPGPTDAWLTLGALARETSRIRLGTLVTSATFRLPGPLAVMVAQVDRMSGGRVELGIGAGWYEREHTSYGIPFPAVEERFDRLEEQLAVITGLWRTPVGEGFSHRGDHYRLVDAPALPKPVQVPGPPIIVGGRGPKRTPALAARYADEFNMPFKSVAETARAYQRVAEACDRTGRADSGRPPLVLSAGVVAAIGRTDAEARRRAAPLHVKSALPPEDPVVGSPARLVERLGEFAEIGASRIHLRLTDFTDLDHLELIASEVLPQLEDVKPGTPRACRRPHPPGRRAARSGATGPPALTDFAGQCTLRPPRPHGPPPCPCEHSHPARCAGGGRVDIPPLPEAPDVQFQGNLPGRWRVIGMRDRSGAPDVQVTGVS